MTAVPRVDDWFLTPDERGNDATELDRRRGDGLAWTEGNEVEVLVHGAEYFRRLHDVLCELEDDFLMFAPSPADSLAEDTECKQSPIFTYAKRIGDRDVSRGT